MMKNFLAIGICILCSNYGVAQQKKQISSTFKNPFEIKQSAGFSKPITPIPNAPKKGIQQLKPKIEIVNGSFFSKIENYRFTKEHVNNNLNSWFNLSKNHTFKEISEKTDELGITHTYLQQFYKGFSIEGNFVMFHYKNDKLSTINGQIAEFENLETVQNIKNEDAITIAKKHLNVIEIIKIYPVDTIITSFGTLNGMITKHALKVRIESYNPFTMCEVYVDAQTGKVLNTIPLIADADVSGSGPTMYSGNQSITCDKYIGGYRLRDSARKIETYDASNATNFDTINGFTGVTDFTNNATTFKGMPVLNSFSIVSVSQNWWYSFFADQLPDLYIKIIDGSNKVIYISNPYNNQNPQVTFNNINVIMNNPPYKVEVWDYDIGSANDFGGTYSIATNSGTQNWSGYGNSGIYNVSMTGNPALDLHWGMGATYDFYLNVFKRKSYDGKGGLIKQYLNPPTLQSQNGHSPNNASSIPNNFMVYGMGDGQNMRPWVSLDIEGHEFTHMVVNNNGNGGLKYQGESGALNESFADIFGTCVEFYSGVNPEWNIGEDIMVNDPYLRSMSNPNGGKQPDTYNGNNWKNPLETKDDGWVHNNSGVQNFWFYLLSQGGSGINDFNNSYSVDSIGIEQASKIAYRNLTTYLGTKAKYIDAYYGSLQAAEDLYGNPSKQYDAVKQAWFAVGIGNDPNSFCSGTTYVKEPSGTITDGSGSANYKNNSNCKWVIAPSGAIKLSLTFTQFYTESEYDTVFVYNGPNENFPLLATWWGNTLPPVLYTDSGIGAMCIRFTSDALVNDIGWSANFQAYSYAPSCNGVSVLTAPSGTFTDGSNNKNYGNNQLCFWAIAPPCANSVTLSFSQFSTEKDFDGIAVYSDLDGINKIGVFTGTSLPSSITSNTGVMLIVFVSDYSTSLQGFSASYTSTGSAYCSGINKLNTSDYGTFSDGSGSNNYCNNQDCKWLIQPPQATSVTLYFAEFELEEAATDGNIYDFVEVYDGSTPSATLLGRFTGSNLPPSITSSGGSLLVRFISDLTNNKQGFSAYYTSTQAPYCSGNVKTLSAQSGTFADGSMTNNYANNTNCAWLIQPVNAKSITLSFSNFNTELDYDGLVVYDGANNSATVLNQFSGTFLPGAVTSSGGSMYIEFLSDAAVRGQGWTANYTSVIPSGIVEELIQAKLNIFPNPTNGIFNLRSDLEYSINIDVCDILGNQVLNSFQINKGDNQVDASQLSKGVYLIKMKIEGTTLIKRLIIN